MEKMASDGPKEGQEDFFPTNPDLANILGRTDLDFEIFNFFHFLDPKFLESQKSGFPDFQKSGFPGFQKIHTAAGGGRLCTIHKSCRDRLEQQADASKPCVFV